jgi:mycothiol synthase
MIPLERPETLAMVWPAQSEAPKGFEVADCAIWIGSARSAFEQVQQAAGWTVTDDAWGRLLRDLVSNAMVVVLENGKPVGTACALSRHNGWVELAWVAVVPSHRGQGYGAMVCAALTRHLLESGHLRLFGSTQDARLAALRIYLALGFHPVYRPGKTNRWRVVCDLLGTPFEPGPWGWPAQSFAPPVPRNQT